ncbi:hypothetical protein K438DRAFT_676569 [Mycena galopus ATCC 62051]|nr:hypothetical protein K438DRAFT_676569 [Mycena galopus ATCC 62051]
MAIISPSSNAEAPIPTSTNSNLLSSTPVMMTGNVSGETVSPLPVIRLPANTGSAGSPLPVIRIPAREAREAVQATQGALPTVCTGRAISPDTVEHDGDKDELRDIEDKQNTVGGALIEDMEPVLNPVRTQTAQTQASIASFLVPSTDRSMVNQTMRSFESRPGTSNRAKAPADSTTAALSRTASSSSLVTFDDVAPSGIEIYTQAGLLPISKGEKAAAHRIRTDENELRVCTHIVAITRRLRELEGKTDAQFSEVLMRLKDINKSVCAAAAKGTGNTAAAGEIGRIMGMVLEGRTVISNLTAAVNELVDLPHDVSHLSHAINALSFMDDIRTQAEAVVFENPRGVGVPVETGNYFPGFNLSSKAGGSKRSGPVAGFEDCGDNKRNKTHADDGDHRRKKTYGDEAYTDIYLWDINLDQASAKDIARRAFAELKMEEFWCNVISVAHPPNTPKTLISIRFRAVAIAELFVDHLRSNPPGIMAKLHAAKSEAYVTKGKGAVKGNAPWYT